MARKPKPPLPTPGELELLDVLWRQGEATVREVHEALPGTGRAGYTTVLKLLQIMLEKGLVERDETGRAHVYRATIARENTQSHLLQDLAKRAFGGSAHRLALHALSEAATAEELAEVRTLLDRLENGRA
jgi:BlaI family transcriptional regulator, penicillinase repressor